MHRPDPSVPLTPHPLPRLSFDRPPAWHALLVAGATALGTLLLTDGARAAGGLLPDSQFAALPAIVELGQPVTLRVEGAPGDVPVVLGSLLAGPTFVPRVGTLDVGFGAGGPFFVFLPPLAVDGTGQITGATDCGWPLLGTPIHLQVVTLGAKSLAPASISNPVVLQFAGGDCGGSVRGAVTDAAWSAAPGPAALSLPGLATDLRLLPGAQFVERSDGTARLLGVVARGPAPAQQFVVDFALSGRVDPGAPHFPPGGSPTLDLFAGAYAPAGPVRPENWHYYGELSGALVGVGEWTGGRLAVSSSVTDVQVGTGANGRNLRHGAFGRLHLETLAQPGAGPAFPVTFPAPGELALDLDAGDPACATAPDGGSDKAAFWLPGISTQLRFDPAGVFAEADGGATLTGLLVDGNSSQRRLRVELVFSGRASPGSAGFPPAGSPLLQLGSADYAAQGGPVDPAAWRYYTGLSGTLTGEGDWDGALLSLQGPGPAFQVGFGANGKTLAPGASGPVSVTVLSQPNQGGKKLKAEKEAAWIRLEFGTCP